jgi:hypothetical protein
MNDAVKIKEGHHIFTTRRCWCNGIQSVMYYRSYGWLRTKIECDSCFYASDKQSTEFEIRRTTVPGLYCHKIMGDWYPFHSI